MQVTTTAIRCRLDVFSRVARWVIVTQDVRNSPPFLKSPYGVGTWKVDTMEKAFRFIRLRSTGVNGRCVVHYT